MSSTIPRGFRGVVTALGIAFAAANCYSVDLEDELISAQSSLAERDFRRALLHLGNVLQVDPANAEARAMRGDIALAVGDYRSAATEYEAALDRGIEQMAIALRYAEALAYSGNLQEARTQLATAETFLPESSEFWILKAEAAVLDRDVDGAAEALARADTLGPPSARSLTVRAGLEVLGNELAKAQATLEEAAGTFPDDSRVHAALGQLHVQMGNLPLASEELRRAVAEYRAEGAVLPQVPILLSLVQIAVATRDPAAASDAATQLREVAPDSSVSLYVDGLVEYQAGRFGNAVGLIERAVQARSDVPQFLTLLGAVQLALGNLGQAEQYLQQAIRQAPQDPAPAKLLAETRLRQQRPDAALDALRTMTGLAETDAQIAYLTGVASLQRGDTEAALAALEQAGVIESAELQRALLELFGHVRARDIAAGMVSATSLVERFPSHPQALTAAAVFHLNRNNAAQADALLARAVAVDSGFVAARLLRAERLMQAKLPDEAAAELNVAAQASPSNPSITLARGRLALVRGDADAALKVANELKSAYPDRAEAFLLEGDSEIARRRYDVAAVAFELALERNAGWSIRSRYISALELADRQGEALEQYLTAVDDDRNNVVALNNAAWLLHKADRAGEALPLAERANTLAPNNPAILDTLGWILVRLNRERDAVVALEKAVASAPDAAEIRYHLAVAKAQSGDMDEARAQIEALLRSDVPFEQRTQAEALLETL